MKVKYLPVGGTIALGPRDSKHSLSDLNGVKMGGMDGRWVAFTRCKQNKKYSFAIKTLIFLLHYRDLLSCI